MDLLRRPPAWLQGVLLVVLALAAFSSALPNRWIWDDNDYVTENPVLTEDGGLERMWTEPSSLPQYYPLVHTTFWIERRLWGDDDAGGPNPFGYHLDNVLLHGLGAVLLWRLLLRLGLPGAWMLAALWMVHPVNVESVAWVTERKNVLSLLLALGSILLSLRWAEKRSPLVLGAAVLLFAGALASKTVVASAPAVTLLLLWWKRHPLNLRVVAPLAVMLVLGGFAGWLTAVAEVEHVGAEGQAWDHTMVERCLISGRILWSYLGTLVWPAKLIFIYPQWDIDVADAAQWLYPAAAVALVGLLFAMRRRWGRGPLVAALIFGGVLFPALGFLNVFPHQFSFVADHFQYHAAIAMVVLLARVVFYTAAGRPRAELTRYGAPALLVVFGALSFLQGRIYADEPTLWKDTVARNPGASIGYNNLGRMAYEESALLRRQAVQPDVTPEQRQRMLDRSKELLDESIELLERSVETGPMHPQALNNLSQVLLGHRLDELPPAQQAALMARIEEMLKQALELAPEYVKPFVNLGDLYRRQNRLQEAIRNYERANELNSRNMRRLAGPQADGRVPQVCINLGVLQLFAGRPEDAIANLAHAAKNSQTAIPAAINLVWVYSTHPDPTVRDSAQALRWAAHLQASGSQGDPRVLDARAAAYASAGDFAQAVQVQRDAVFGAMRTGQNSAAGRMRQRLELYEAGQPLRTRIGLPE
ncbi:MAG: tetratricopeptide repeat protein [Planctomycetes bacterium]|nr:tetratricopeptide repeat protein [Planctomycetota bacterium]